MKLEQITLTSRQKADWDMTRTALMWQCPAFTHIFYTMMNNAHSDQIAFFTKDIPIAATDGACLLLNPETFFKYSLKQRVFICAHEIMHCVWNHLVLSHRFRKANRVGYPDGTSLPYSHELMNIAEDYVINDALIEGKIGEYSKDWLHDKTLGTADEASVDVYRKVFKEAEKQGRIKYIEGAGAGRFDEHLDPGTSQGKDPNQAAAQRNDVEWKTQVAAAINSAKAQGKLPGGLERLFNDILNPAVDWKDKIAALFARKVGSGSYSWRRADRRLIVRDIYAPGRSGFGAGTVVVGVDTSGSIGQRELDMFFAEMAGILDDVRPQRLVVMWCDAQVHRVDEAEDPMDLNTIRCKGAPGGGGTAFGPVFDEIKKMGLEPDALVYLTDGYGSFPQKSPPYTTIWGNISPPDSVEYPFGDVVDVPKQAA